MKTIFLSTILIGITYYSIRSLLRSFKGESKCGECPGAKNCKIKSKIK